MVLLHVLFNSNDCIPSFPSHNNLTRAGQPLQTRDYFKGLRNMVTTPSDCHTCFNTRELIPYYFSVRVSNKRHVGSPTKIKSMT